MEAWAEELRNLYLQSSKHSNYQILPQELENILRLGDKDICSRYEKARLDYIIEKLEVSQKKILDIGGNTGFFSFECIKGGCQSVDYYEGNPLHAEFVSKAAKIYDDKKIKVHNEYYLFDKTEKKYDIVFCLNVVHHLGADFYEVNDMEKAKNAMLNCINNLAYTTNFMVFQMGYNWCGNRDKCLFENGTKQEMEQLLLNGTEKCWTIQNIGIAVKSNENVRYEEKNDANIIRNDALGEFLNRPIFIMKSKKC